MTIEIEFRAWDGENEKMITGFGLDPNNIPYIIPDGTEYPDEFDYYPDAILMQYTGLKDKNKKMIFDGDIFKCIGGKGVCMQGEVYFDEGCFRMKYGYQEPKKEDRTDYFLSNVIENEGAEHIEIIGNIYENKELLKGGE